MLKTVGLSRCRFRLDIDFSSPPLPALEVTREEGAPGQACSLPWGPLAPKQAAGLPWVPLLLGHSERREGRGGEIDIAGGAAGTPSRNLIILNLIYLVSNRRQKSWHLLGLGR